VCIADVSFVEVTPWQFFFILGGVALVFIGMGTFMVVVGRSGRKFKNISPYDQRGYKIWATGGWVPIVMGFGLILFDIAVLIYGLITGS
jgi:hypothetical protein